MKNFFTIVTVALRCYVYFVLVVKFTIKDIILLVYYSFKIIIIPDSAKIDKQIEHRSRKHVILKIHWINRPRVNFQNQARSRKNFEEGPAAFVNSPGSCRRHRSSGRGWAHLSRPPTVLTSRQHFGLVNDVIWKETVVVVGRQLVVRFSSTPPFFLKVRQIVSWWFFKMSES